MKKFVFTIAITAITFIVFSCSRSEDHYDNTTSSEIVSSKGDPTLYRGGGEDDDKQIIIRIFGRTQAPIAGVSITMIGVYNKPDTLVGTTDANGECSLLLPRGQNWRIGAGHPGYRPLQQLVTLTDSVNVRDVTLEDE